MWMLALRYAPRIVAAFMLMGLLYAGAAHERRLGYQQRWGEDFVRELRQDMAQARLADGQMWKTNVENLHELVGWFVRFNAWTRYEAAAAALTAGLSGRVWDAERRLQGVSVPGGGTRDGAEIRGVAGAEGAERLRGLEQTVYDACGRDGAALEALAIRPLCECSRGP